MSHSEQLARKFDDRVAARDAAAVAAAAVARRHPGTPPRADAELQVDVAASITALEELAGVLGACAADVAASGLLPFPNPMGLPRPPER